MAAIELLSYDIKIIEEVNKIIALFEINLFYNITDIIE